MKEKDFRWIMQAATHGMEGYLPADGCAAFLGLFTPDGKPNRRAFLEDVATATSFPPALRIGTRQVWRKAAVAEWAEQRERRAA